MTFGVHLKFQSMPPRGGQLWSMEAAAPAAKFQSMPPRGGQHGAARHDIRRPVSIHAPAWGATAVRVQAFALLLFQSMPPRGGQHFHGRYRLHLRGFNPCPRVGGNPVQSRKRGRPTMFQSMPPRGGQRTPREAT